MARADDGTSGLAIPPSDRVTGANALSWNQQGDHSQNQDRRQQYKNPHRASIFDLLFEEVDATPEIEEPVKRRLKQNVRRNFRQQTETPQTAPPRPKTPPAQASATGPSSARVPQAKSPPIKPATPSHAAEVPLHRPPTPADDLVKVVIPSIKATDTEHLIGIAADNGEKSPSDQIIEARRIASQLRYCLSQHTETAQKVSAYLRALLVLTHGHYKPTLVIEV